VAANYVFTLTAGRTGTAWLAAMLGANLDDCEAHHEFLGWDCFGVDTPDLSHLTLFNSRGVCEEVRGFWRRKLARVAACPRRWYVETAHVLMKAGLVEHLDLIADRGRIHLVILGRDLVSTVASYSQRGDFSNKGNQWLWYLDPDYPQNILNPVPFKQHGVMGIRVWYWMEIEARQAYYAALLADRAGVNLLRCTLLEVTREPGARRLLRGLGCEPAQVALPPPLNVTHQARQLGERELAIIAELCRRFPDDPRALGAEHYRRGRRLGAARD